MKEWQELLIPHIKDDLPKSQQEYRRFSCSKCGKEYDKNVKAAIASLRKMGSIVCRSCSQIQINQNRKSWTSIITPYYPEAGSLKNVEEKIKYKCPKCLKEIEVKALTLVRGIRERNSNGWCRGCVQNSDRVSEAISKAQKGKVSPLLTNAQKKRKSKLISEAISKRWKDPEYKEHHLSLIKDRWQDEDFRRRNLQGKLKITDKRLESIAKTVSKKEYQRFKQLVKSEGFTLISEESEYTNHQSRLTMICPEGHIFLGTRSGFVNYHRCSECRINKPESEIIDFCKSFDHQVYSNVRSVIPPKELDVWIPSKKLAIEHNGLYWHSERITDKHKNIEKRKLAEEKDINLIFINEDEWNHKTDIVKSIIRQKMGCSKKLYARKTKLELNVSLKKFFEENHLMGFSSARTIALVCNDEIVSGLSYKKFRGQQDVIEIVRFCSKLNCQVVGAFSKLLKSLINKEQPKKIVSYVDLRYGDGHSYEKLGFIKVGETLGWKWTDYYHTFNRLQCRANMDSRQLTQSEQAQEWGWCKIYDAGQAKYELVC